MATVIEGIIFDGDPRTAAVPAGLRTAPLACGLTMLPVTQHVLDRIDTAAVGDERIPAHWILQQPVAALARAISAGRSALYIYRETAGGPGTAEAIAWRDGRLLYGPSGTCDIEADFEPGYHLATGRDTAVSAGLRAMGVRAGDAVDEYAAAGLTRHRMTGDWLRDA